MDEQLKIVSKKNEKLNNDKQWAEYWALLKVNRWNARC